MGESKDAWWSYPPYKFILETTRPKAGIDANLSFYIVEEKSMWYKPIFNEKIKDINIMDEKIIGSVKIIVSKQFYADAGMILKSHLSNDFNSTDTILNSLIMLNES